MNRLVPLVLVLAAGCASPPPPASVAAYVGRPIREVERDYGPARFVVAESGGGWRYSYAIERPRFPEQAAAELRVDQFGMLRAVPRESPTIADMDSCETVFTVDAAGLVTAARQGGNACARLMIRQRSGAPT